MVSTLIVLLIFAVLAVAICYRPAYVLALAFCVYGFEQWAQVSSPIFATHASLINFAFGGLSLLALVVVITKGKNPLDPIAIGQVVLALLFVYSAASCLWSIDSNVSTFLFKYHVPYIGVFVFLLPTIVSSSEDIRAGLISALALGTVTMLLLLLTTSTSETGRGIEVDHQSTVVRDRANQERAELAPLAVAEMAGTLAIIAVLLNYSGAGRVWAILRWGVVFLAMVLIVRSGSRGQLIALVVLPLFFGTSRGYGRAANVAVAVCLLGIGVFAALWVLSGANELIAGRFETAKMVSQFEESRVVMCSNLLEEWMASSPIRWLFGLGSSASFEVIGVYPHVMVVEVLAELGFVGLAILLASLMMAGKSWLRLAYACEDDKLQRGVVAALGAILTYFLLLSFKQGMLLGHTTLFMSAMIISRYDAIVAREKSRETSRQKRQMVVSQLQASPS